MQPWDALKFTFCKHLKQPMIREDRGQDNSPAVKKKNSPVLFEYLAFREMCFLAESYRREEYHRS